MSFTLIKLAEAIGGTAHGDENIRIDGVNTLADAREGDVSFFINRKYRKDLKATTAAAVILKEDDQADCPVAAIIVANPHVAYAKAANLLYPVNPPPPGIHATAVVEAGCQIDESAWIGPHVVLGEGVQVGARTYIGPGCIIGNQVEVGKDSRLLANVTVMHDCSLGNRVLLHAGAVIGSDGLGQADDNGRWIKIPQIGRVIVQDDVEIGANATIDRGAVGDTEIGEGVKLDNLVHIAHNVYVGSNTLMAAMTGVAGSATIGEHCITGGQVGISGHLTITDYVTITGRGSVRQSITEPGVYSSGTPLEPIKAWTRNHMRMKQVDEMAKRIKELEDRLDGLEGKG